MSGSRGVYEARTIDATMTTGVMAIAKRAGQRACRRKAGIRATGRATSIGDGVAAIRRRASTQGSMSFSPQAWTKATIKSSRGSVSRVSAAVRVLRGSACPAAAARFSNCRKPCPVQRFRRRMASTNSGALLARVGSGLPFLPGESTLSAMVGTSPLTGGDSSEASMAVWVLSHDGSGLVMASGGARVQGDS